MRVRWSSITVDEDEVGRVAPRGWRRARLPPEPEAPPPRRKTRVLHHLLAGAVAGSTAKTVEAPLDRVKIIFQVSKQKFSFRAAARQMVAIARNEGVAGLWKGNGAAAAGRRPAGHPQRGPQQRLFCSHPHARAAGAMMMRVVPYASINYAAHEVLSRVRPSERGCGLRSAANRRASATPPRAACWARPPGLCGRLAAAAGRAAASRRR